LIPTTGEYWSLSCPYSVHGDPRISSINKKLYFLIKIMTLI
jgi:hypothetical protein